MPRIQPNVDTGPALTVSQDGAWVALLDGDRLSLLDARTHAAIGSVALPSSAVGELHVTPGSEPRILVAQREEAALVLHAFTVPGLEPLARRDFPGRWRARAFVGARALIIADEPGELPQLVTLTSRAIVVENLPLRPGVGFAAAAPEERILVETKGQLEFWDLLAKVALFRLNLAMPPAPQQAAFAARGRLLWIASSDATGRFDVFRFSDGRPQLQVELGASIVGVDGTAEGSRVVVATRSAKDALELSELDLLARDRRAIAAGGPVAAFALVEGAPPQVVVSRGAGQPLEWLPIGARPRSATSPATTAVKPALAPRPAPSELRASPAGHGLTEERPAETPRSEERPTAGGGAANSERVVDRLNAWRARLRGTTAGAALGGSDGATPPDEADAPVAEGDGAAAARVDERDAPEGRSLRRAFNAAAARVDPDVDAPSEPAEEEAASPPAKPAERSTFAQRLAASRALDRARAAAADEEAGGSSRNEAAAPPAASTASSMRRRFDASRTRTAPAETEESSEPSVEVAAPASRPDDDAPPDAEQSKPAAATALQRFAHLRGRTSAKSAAPTSSAAAPASAHTASTSRSSAPRASEGLGGWRASLCAWAAEALARQDGAATDPPDHDAPALRLLERRFDLDDVARRALALLYGEWLLDGGRGLPAARLAVAIGEAGDWRESLGLGALGRAGLVERKAGRTRLRRVVGRLLDGRVPQVSIQRGDGESAPPGFAGTSRLQLASGETPDELAATLSRDFGCDFAIVDLRPSSERSFEKRAADAIVEARIYGAVPLVAVGAAAANAAASWLPLLEDGPALVALSGACPPALEHLSPWEREGD